MTLTMMLISLMATHHYARKHNGNILDTSVIFIVFTVMPSLAMPSVGIQKNYAEYCHDECHYAECRYAVPLIRMLWHQREGWRNQWPLL